MIVKKLEIENFRNIEKLSLVPGEKVNIICGENAQGKTNLMEALWLFTGAKSFRQTKDKDFIRFGEEKAKLFAEFIAEKREQNAEIQFDPKRAITKNGIEMRSAAEYAGTCGGVVFSPNHMNFFRDGPSERRKLLDTSLCQLYPRYLDAMVKYKRILEQRNALVKDIRFHTELLDMLDIYDSQMMEIGSFILHIRERYCEKLNEKAAVIYEGMSGGKEKFNAEFRPSIFRDHMHLIKNPDISLWKDVYKAALKHNRDYDIEHGVTSQGPHRDDIEITLDGNLVSAFGSQGQQRSCILSIKLAEAKILGEAMGEPPLILLDDVMSELDFTRREYILNSIGDSQIFLTCCDKELFAGLEEGKVFLMESGEIKEI